MQKLLENKILLLGEAVLDLISMDVVDTLDDAESFIMFSGGEVSNLAANLARVGFSSSLASCLGKDNIGNFIKNELLSAGVDLSLMQTSLEYPTTLVTVTRSTGTPDFCVYRGADQELIINDDLFKAAKESRAIHTSAFALSRDPSRSTILSILRANQSSGKLLSFDPNYHPNIWPDNLNYLSILKDFFPLFIITKPSLDDAFRIFGPGLEPATYLNMFLDLGSKHVILTMGQDGSILGTDSGDRYHIHPEEIPVVDVTGAGDAFWTGVYAGFLNDFSALESAKLGQTIAEYKIGILGPIKDHLPLENYIAEAQKRDFSII